MYWPCGVPRVYAYHGPRYRENAEEEEEEEGDEIVKQRTTQSSLHEMKQDNGTNSARKSSAVIVGLSVATSESFFTVITASSLAIWQSRPNAVLAITNRSSSSLEKYGANEFILLRADGAIAVVQTSNGYLLTYSMEFDPHSRVYQQQFGNNQVRRQSSGNVNAATNDAGGFREVILQLKRAIKVDAGIKAVVALPNELVVATERPPAVQCLKWDAGDGLHTSAELLSKADWIQKKSVIVGIVHNRAMHLAIWIFDDGKAYAVQRQGQTVSRSRPSIESSEPHDLATGGSKLFYGHCFHEPQNATYSACLVAVNAKFSLLAVGCQNGELLVYGVKDYAGNISLSHTIGAVASPTSTGRLTCLTYSPDGYCLFVGYEKGWATWSVFGKAGISSFTSCRFQTEIGEDGWLSGVSTANWTAGGAELLLTSIGDYRIWKLEFSRSAATGCFSCANLVRALLQKPSELVIYRGHDMPDLNSISGEASLWHHAPFPTVYLHNQGPIKCSVVSQDGRYAAIAGRRGLAHYSVQSGRWKTFADPAEEDMFTVKGGMCWFSHVVIAATESDGSYGLRAYSRDAVLGQHKMLCLEALPAPIVFLGPSGEDSLLVYTSENILYHFVISITNSAMKLVQVGQIAFHGVVRAPTRVRSVSWILPENQLRNGDPSQDVTLASVLFLVDDKLVLLQPSPSEDGSLRYDMRVLVQHIEFYILMRDQLYFNFANKGDESTVFTPSPGHVLNGMTHRHTLRDSLWTFGGKDLQMWTDVRDVLRMALEGSHMSSNLFLLVPVDFYPLSILLSKGVVLGIDSELVQRQDLPFVQFRTPIRTHLFIPYLLQHRLSTDANPSSALALAHQYEHLSYFAHALEVLLHLVLDLEASFPQQDIDASRSLLPAVLSLLYSSLSESSYLSAIVQCVRKTEITQWPILLVHLPPPSVLFEQALQLDDLKTATGFLIVLQSYREDLAEENGGGQEDTEKYVARLIVLAQDKGDWELCSELAQFLMALDPTGDALRRVIEAVGFSRVLTDGSNLPKGLRGLGVSILDQSE